MPTEGGAAEQIAGFSTFMFEALAADAGQAYCSQYFDDQAPWKVGRGPATTPELAGATPGRYTTDIAVDSAGRFFGETGEDVAIWLCAALLTRAGPPRHDESCI